MDAYTGFAGVYDLFMDNVPYEAWADRIDRLIREYNEMTVPNSDPELSSEAALLVDLGCGTGTLTRLLKARGHDCIGVDSSCEMLEIAASYEEGDDRILYINSDMRELELYSTAGTFICMCDSVNYLTEGADVLKVFRLVNNYLFPGGLFIFDFNTVHYYRDVLGGGVIAENRPEASFIWENYYDEEERVNECDLTIYARTGAGLYERTEETHVQRGYEPGEMLSFVEEAGMIPVRIFDADTEGEVTQDTSRVCMVVREHGK